MQMESSLISKIAAESAENSAQRELLARKLLVLQAGLETCRQYAGRGALSLQHRTLPPLPRAKYYSDESDSEEYSRIVAEESESVVLTPATMDLNKSQTDLAVLTSPFSTFRFGQAPTNGFGTTSSETSQKAKTKDKKKGVKGSAPPSLSKDV